MKLPKCHFARKLVEFLRHVLTPEGLQPNPGKVTAVQLLSAPHNVSGSCQFLGLTSYCRRYIANFSKIASPLNHLIKKEASPLHHLIKKEAEWNWTKDCQQAFDLLKKKMTSAPVLSYASFDLDFVFETDASIIGVGAIPYFLEFSTHLKL